MKTLATRTYLLLGAGVALGALIMAGIQSGKLFPHAEAQRPASLRAIGNIDKNALDALKSLDTAFSSVAEYALASTVQVMSENPNSRGQNGRLTSMVKGEGSGVIYRPDGYILTNDHVVNGFSKVTVLLADGKTYEAKVITAEDSDIAVLKIDANNLPALPLADSSRVKPGQYAIAVGSPFGLENSVTVGHVSAMGRPSQVPDEHSAYGARYYPNMIQTDAAINMGNSGGPLINVDGEVIGINTAIFSRTGENVGIGFAIPANQVKLIADTLISKGKITRGFMGLAPTNLKVYQLKEMNLNGGALVLPFSNDVSSPAKDAGIQEGDVVVRIGSVNVVSEMDLRNSMLKYGPGETVEVEVVRNGQHKTFKVKLTDPPKAVAMNQNPGVEQSQQAPDSPFGDIPDLRDFQKQFERGFGNDQKGNSDVAPLKSGRAKLGVSVDTMTGTLRNQYSIPSSIEGAVVGAVEPGSVAERLGLRPGDVITQLGGKSIRSAADLSEAMKDVKWGDTRHITFGRYGKGTTMQSSRDVTFR